MPEATGRWPGRKSSTPRPSELERLGYFAGKTFE
jgi:hypothetical protein